MARAFETDAGLTEPASELDLRALGAALKRRRRAIWLPTLIVFALAAIYVNVTTPRFTAESQVLLENQETFFTRPDRVNPPPDQASLVDPEAVASQIQLISSRDLARRAIKQLHLQGNPEFDPLARGMGPLKRILVLLGVSRDPTRDTADARIVTAFLEKLTVFSPPKTRVITIQFTSSDPELAARAADTVAALYLQEQSSAKRTTAKDSADALAAQITDLRGKLARADADRELYRTQSGLLAGSNNMTVSGQQLADINTDLSRARSAQADAQAKASMIRDLLRSGKAADVPDVINNDIVRRVSEQRVTAQAQLALESRTLLPGHPRIKELTAQVAQLDIALKAAAKQAATTLENEAKIAGQRVVNLEAVLNQQKQIAGTANTDEVHLRALERTTQSYKDQLESSSAKYQEALARQSSTATPADARVISQASVPQEASFPKKLPIVVFATVAGFVFSLGFVVAGELLSGGVTVAPRGEATIDPEPRRPRPSGDASITPAKTKSPSAPKPPGVAKRSSILGSLMSDHEDADPVFAPVARVAQPEFDRSPSAEAVTRHETRTFRETRTIGDRIADRLPKIAMIGTIADYLRAFGLSAMESRRVEPRAPTPVVASAGVGWEPDDQSDWKIERREAERRGGERRNEDRRVARTQAQDTDLVSSAPDPAEPVFAAPVLAASQETQETQGVDDATRAVIDPPGNDLVNLDATVARIIATHVPGRGLHVVGTSIGSDASAIDTLIGLGRALADKGRAIIVDLNRTPVTLANLLDPDAEPRKTIMTIQGLSELLAGEASFAEVIHRDHRSRLHFIPTGRIEADFHDFDLILDALSETYDFIVLLTPSYPQSEIAKVMAPYAAFVVLATSGAVDPSALATLESDLVEAGAQEVLVAGRAGRPASRAQVVA